MYKRARTTEQIKETKKDIIKALDSLYLNKELNNIYLKDIADKTRISRTAIYKYYKNKEEILLDSLKYHFIFLDDELEALKNTNKDMLAKEIADIFTKHKIILKIMSSNLEDIEKTSTLASLVCLKSEFKRFQDLFRHLLIKNYPQANIDIINQILYAFISSLYGFYPLANPMPLQKEAMKQTNTFINISLNDLITTTLTLLFKNLD